MHIIRSVQEAQLSAAPANIIIFFPPTVVKMKKIDYQYARPQVYIGYNLFCHASSASHPAV